MAAGGFSHKRPSHVVPIWEQNHRWVFDVTLLQREVLEAKAVGGASTLKEERKPRPVVSLTERSEPYNGTVLHTSRAKQSANAPRIPVGGAMWPREPTARSGDIGAASDCHLQRQSHRVLLRSTAVCAEAKNTKSLAARARGCGHGQSDDSERGCEVKRGRSGFGERCGRAVMCKRRHRQRIR
jgi:hypothetical protein